MLTSPSTKGVHFPGRTFRICVLIIMWRCSLKFIIVLLLTRIVGTKVTSSSADMLPEFCKINVSRQYDCDCDNCMDCK